MARLLYACRFDVEGQDGLKKTIESYSNWITQYYRQQHSLGDFEFDSTVYEKREGTPDGHVLSSELFEDGRYSVVRIRWSFPDDNDEGLRWTNEIRVGQFEGRCGVEHLINIESIYYNISPARLQFGSPRVIRNICSENNAYIGDMRLRAVPYPLHSAGLSELLDLLVSDLRRLPVILLSPHSNGQPNQIDSALLARKLAAVAIVVRVDDPQVTWDFADEVGRQLSCFDGAARIYWPGFSSDSDPRSHRLFLGPWIDRVGPSIAARTIEQTVFSVATFRYLPDKRIADVVRRTEAAERQKVLAQKKETNDEFLAEYERDLIRLEEVEKRAEELEAENATLRSNQEVLFASAAGISDELLEIVEPEEQSFASVSDAVHVAEKRFSNLEILNSAIAAAAKSPFKRPFDVFKALQDLNELVDDWTSNLETKGSGGDLLEHLRRRGYGKRSSMHISTTTLGKYGAHYEFQHQGKKRIFEPHITIGSGDPNSCASIHFILDPEERKIVVGHVGKHLPNTKT